MKKVLIVGSGQVMRLNLQQFASFDEVVSEHADDFGEDDKTKESFDAAASKLKALGYDVLINHREKAEFIPSSRLGEVVSQREAFKLQAEQALVKLAGLQGQAGLSDEAQTQIKGLIESNELLLTQLQEANVNLDIMSSASDAINPKDVLPFIDMSKIKQDKTGKVVSGVKEEIDRIRTEKPYLFGKQGQVPTKGGFDSTGGAGANTQIKSDMNSAIRRAAYGNTKNF